MSLISIRNLALPLQSKVQVGALLIITLLVLVIRLGIGSIDNSSNEPSSPKTDPAAAGRLYQDAADEQDKELIDLLNNSRPAAKKRQERPESDDLLNGLVDGSYDREAKQERQRKDRGGESFDDIRKTLGL